MEKNILTETKAAMAVFFAALTAGMGMLAYPVYIMILVGVLDYITGYTAAPYRGEQRNTKRAVQGIIKKVFTWLLVVIGAIFDGLLTYAAETVGIPVLFHFFIAALVAVWLICNEIISILENIGDIGVDLPPFLLKAVKWVKTAAEDKGDITSK